MWKQSVRKKNGFYQCEFCGTKYSPEEAKKLFVSGSVELVKGDEEKNRLLNNGNYFLDIGDITNAEKVHQKLTFDYPNDNFVQEYSKKFTYQKLLYKYHKVKLSIIQTFQNLLNSGDYYKIVSLQIDNSGDSVIIQHLIQLYNVRDVLINKGYTDFSPFDNIDSSIVDTYYETIHKNYPMNSINKEIIYYYVHCYEKVYFEPIRFTPNIEKWSYCLTEEYIKRINSGKTSYYELFGDRLFSLDRFFKVINMNRDKVSDIVNEFWNLYTVGKACGKFLNNHRYVLDDILVERMHRSSYDKDFIFAYGNTINFISDYYEYGLNFGSAKVVPIKSLSQLKQIAAQKKPSDYCPRCGGFLGTKLSRIWNGTKCQRCGLSFK